jgi:purine-binding chemotaxis protein CheW
MEISDELAPADARALEEAAQDRQFVTFSVAGEMFAVQMAPVQEIIRVPTVARLPLAPHSLDGLANLRGRVLPIVNLRRIFGVDARAHDDATRAVVINLGQPLGFVVDHVSSVIGVEPEEIEPAHHIQSVVQSDYLTGVIKRPSPEGGKDQLLLVLDFDRLVREQFASIAQMQAARGQSRITSQSHESPEAVVDDKVTSDELRLVSFTVAGQEYAIDIADVREIVQRPDEISELPNTPSHVLGLMSLRQRLLPLVGLRHLFGLPDVDHDERHRIVVVSLPDGGQMGLVTDTVKEVLSVPRSQADDMPSLLSHDPGMKEFSAICRLDDGKRLVSIIATQHLPGLSHLSELMSQDNADTPQQESHTMRHESGNDDDTQVVIFRLGTEEYGVPIMSVQEIVRVPEVLTRVPRTPSYAEGVINLRGTVLPVIDQRTRLGLPKSERNDRQRIMVYTLGGLRTGFIVDSVAEVLRISKNNIEHAPELSHEQAKLITRVAKLEGDKRLVMLIEPDQLLGSMESHGMQDLVAHTTEPDASSSASSLASSMALAA